ncbi:UDP-N-acetylglucosamine 1-carboxyvinyltransferase [Halovibrio variabilis]|uniref:UDP-N-acetylglucosamine 1-carboxyvinyltransferase n=1 Tax=Halovibrio variabilis TaxID=31910 RepID=A0A511UUP6_9GAMM|nr:UDP-N-acetylglucosamine 1-carboxyvinyltransferase [Halovibrio variabilis]GEN29661.1 UDP-N-acetylglucosamine 1-carboxyvinyltransferase [Halovibrio variabilis]
MKNSSVLKVNKSRLEGSVDLAGAKNSALRLLAASILTSETLELSNYPSELLDAKIHVDMLSALGKETVLLTNTRIQIQERCQLKSELIWHGRSIRNTLLILGALTARFGHAKVPLPGGCKLGERKYDLHVMLLEKLGARVYEEGEYLCTEAQNGLQGADIDLPMRSTGATENAVIASCLAQGVTRIWNPHIRPEIIDLINMLNTMGAKIRVFGQEHIEVTGVEGLTGAKHKVIADNMEAITWLAAAMITKGDIEINDFPYQDLEVVLAHLKAAGAKLYKGENSLIVRGGHCYPIEISTGPHPGINSDVQPILAAWAAQARGESRIIDLRFPGRYGYAEQMARMGLKHDVAGDMLKIYGQGGGLVGAEVKALDLRAGIALTLCGLAAEGETTITDAWQIGRGYVNLIPKLKSLGAVCSGEIKEL